MTIDDADKALFRDTVAQSAPPDKDAQQLGAKTKQFDKFSAYSYVSEAYLSGSDEICENPGNISTKLIKKMQRGDIDSAPSIDLHGNTLEQACAALSEFIYHHQNARFLQIIHGKGYNSANNLSILKTQAVSFLKQHPQVLAFCSCPPKDGGTGALFVRLKS